MTKDFDNFTPSKKLSFDLIDLIDLIISKQSVTDSVQEKRFGKEIVVLGSQIYKSFYLNYLLKVCFFDSDYSVFN